MEHVFVGLQYQHEGLQRNLFFLDFDSKALFLSFLSSTTKSLKVHFTFAVLLTRSCAFGLSRSSIFLPLDCGQKAHLGFVLSFVKHTASPDAFAQWHPESFAKHAASPDAVAQWHPDAVAHAGFGWLWILPVTA